MKKVYLLMVLCAFSKVQAQEMPNKLSADDKVYGLSKLWQEVNYNFVYYDKMDKSTWDSAYRSLIGVVQKTENDYEYYHTLKGFYGMLKDGHTDVSYPKSINGALYSAMFGKYRLHISNIEGKAIITQTNATAKDEIPYGSEITEVNGMTTKEYIKKNVAPYMSTSTDYIRQDWSTTWLFRGLKGDKYEITILTPAGVRKKLSLEHDKTTERELFPAQEAGRDELLEFKWYPDDIAYIALNSFADKKIDSLFIQKLPEIYKARAIIIDLRNNGGGSTDIGTNILEYLTADKYLYGARTTTRENIPYYIALGAYYSKNKSEMKDDPDAGKMLQCYNGALFYDLGSNIDTVRLSARRTVVPTAVLIGHNTASAAEDFLVYADNQKHIIKIGQNTCGSTGQPYSFSLPGGGSARVCTKKDTYHDGREFVGIGVKPDIEVTPTISDLLQKKDGTLDKALGVLKFKLK
jgi:C-terminal processing protease CtpA/Prc